jgi:hypothetical protein
MPHVQIIQLIVAYTLAGAFVFTALITCLALVGVISLPEPSQQKKLFYVLLVELCIGCVGFFLDFLRFDARQVEKQIGADAIEQREREQLASLSTEMKDRLFKCGLSQNPETELPPRLKSQSWVSKCYFILNNETGKPAVHPPTRPEFKEVSFIGLFEDFFRILVHIKPHIQADIDSLRPQLLDAMNLIFRQHEMLSRVQAGPGSERPRDGPLDDKTKQAFLTIRNLSETLTTLDTK